MEFKEIENTIESEIKVVLDQIDEEKTREFTSLLKRKSKIFVLGQGRSELIGGAFAMRLSQAGYNSHLVGEVTSPPIDHEDLLVAISGTGSTLTTVALAKKAKSTGAIVIAITADTKSKLAKLADLIIEIKAQTKAEKGKSIEPLGSLFEQCTLLYLDSVLIYLIGHKKSIKRGHTNLE